MTAAQNRNRTSIAPLIVKTPAALRGDSGIAMPEVAHPHMPRRLLSAKQLGKRVGRSERWVHLAIKQRLLNPIYVGERPLVGFAEEEVARLLRELPKVSANNVQGQRDRARAAASKQETTAMAS